MLLVFEINVINVSMFIIPPKDFLVAVAVAGDVTFLEPTYTMN